MAERTESAEPGRHIELRSCVSADLPAILSAQSVILDALPDPELLERSSVQELEGYLAGLGEIVGAFDGAQLIGYGILTPLNVSDPRLRKLGQEVADAFALESSAVGVLDTVAVLPSHRGHGLQLVICNEIRRRAALQRITLLLTTVSPKNDVSVKNFKLLGFIERGTMLLYGRKQRSVLTLTIS